MFWCAVERRPAVEALFPDAAVVPDHPCPVPAIRPAPPRRPDAAAADLLRGHLDCRGPSDRSPTLARATGLPDRLASHRLRSGWRQEGFALRGRFGPAMTQPRSTVVRPAAAGPHPRPIPGGGGAASGSSRSPRRDFMRFLLRWQHVAPGTRREGRLGVLSVVEQLQGYELAAGAVGERGRPAGGWTGYRP